jgi:acyl-CoA thioesterase-1
MVASGKGVNHQMCVFLRLLHLMRRVRVVVFGLFVVLGFAGGFSTMLHAETQSPLRVMVLGDSLVAGHGLNHGDAFPDALQVALDAAGYEVEMFNAGVSGDTTAGGLARLDWSLAEEPDAMIIVLGGNDLLRGLDPAATYENLAAIINRLRDRNITVLLAGMQAPRNLGRDYADEFDAVYRRLGAREDVLFYPFFLDGVALVPAFNQADGMHPNKEGVAEITRRILPIVETLMQRTLNR